MGPDLSLMLSANPLLSNCPAETITELLAAGKVHEFKADELLMADADLAGVAIFLLRGSLQMSKATERGRQQIFCNASGCGCDGLCMLAFGDRALADIRGVMPGAVLLVPRAEFVALIRHTPVLCQAAWRSATACMAHLSDLVAQLSFNTVAERVAAMLVRSTQADGDLVRLTQAELAAQVGTTREVVARCLASFQDEGAIRLGRGRIRVLDREKLRS